VKKIVHTLLFWRYREKKMKDDLKETESKDDENGFLNKEKDNNIDQVEQDKDFLESKGVWVRGGSRISNEVCL
jgi:hypothetical protein